jgi:hypothetical protein
VKTPFELVATNSAARCWSWAASAVTSRFVVQRDAVAAGKAAEEPLDGQRRGVRLSKAGDSGSGGADGDPDIWVAFESGVALATDGNCLFSKS